MSVLTRRTPERIAESGGLVPNSRVTMGSTSRSGNGSDPVNDEPGRGTTAQTPVTATIR